MRTALNPAAGAAKCRFREEWNVCMPWCASLLSAVGQDEHLSGEPYQGADLIKMNCEHR